MTPGFLAQPQHVLPHQRARLRVEPDRGLVEEQDPGDVQEGAGDLKAPGHPAGELRDEVIAALAQVDEVEYAGDPLIDLLAGHPVEDRMEAEVLLGGELIVERLLLEDEADVAAHRLGPREDVDAGDPDLSGRRPRQRAQHVDRGRLARPVWAQEREHLALVDVKVDPVDRGELSEPLPQATDLDHPRSKRRGGALRNCLGRNGACHR